MSDQRNIRTEKVPEDSQIISPSGIPSEETFETPDCKSEIVVSPEPAEGTGSVLTFLHDPGSVPITAPLIRLRPQRKSLFKKFRNSKGTPQEIFTFPNDRFLSRVEMTEGKPGSPIKDVGDDEKGIDG